MDTETEVLSETGTACDYVSQSDSLSNQAKLESLEKKAIHLRLVLEKDFKAADLKWSLFVASAFSFRYETCLKPFPPTFMKNGVKDMDAMLTVIADVPALDLVVQQLDDHENLISIGPIIELLFYVLVRLKEPNIKTVPLDTHDAILLNVNPKLPSTKPQFIFQLVNSAKMSAETRWRELAKNQRTFFAYHGNRLENFYSILNFGLQPNVNKSTNGIYLSREINMSLLQCHGGFGWGASCLGGHLSCLALCEVIDAPEGINCQKPVSNEGDVSLDFQKSPRRNLISDEIGDLQMKHYIISNSELVRIRYLLIYAKQTGVIRIPVPRNSRQDTGLRQWFSKHKLFSILLGYGIMLATIGLANNQPIQHYYSIIMKKIDLVLNNAK